MRIVCPACDSAYDVPEAMLAGGKPVRCARCGGRWVPGPAEPVATPIAPPAAEPIVQDPPMLAPAAPQPAFPLALPLAWTASLGAVLTLLLALLLAHRAIAAAWPPMQRLYGLLGL